MTVEDAASLVAFEREINRDVVELATLLSLSTRVEPELVRAMRIELFPDAEAGLESDVWFSSLVQASNATGLTLLPDVIELFRRDLATEVNRERLESARKIVHIVHQGISPAIEWEEEVTYLAIVGTPKALADVDTLFGQVLNALKRDDQALARWVVRTLPRLPERARLSEAAMALAIEAGRQLGSLNVTGVLGAENASTWHPGLVAGLPTETVGVRLLANGLEISHPPVDPLQSIELPRTQPLLLEIGWPTDEGWHGQRESTGLNSTRVFPVPCGPAVRVRTLTGDVHTLSPDFGSGAPRLLLLTRGFDRSPTIVSRIVSEVYMGVSELGWEVMSESPSSATPNAVCVILSSPERSFDAPEGVFDFFRRLSAEVRGFVALQGAAVQVHDSRDLASFGQSWKEAVSQLIDRSRERSQTGSLARDLRPHLIAIDRARADHWIAEASFTRQHAAVEPIEGPELHGRDDALDELKRLCEPAATGVHVMVVGGAGVGKSAILRGFARRRRAEGHTVLYRDLTAEAFARLDAVFSQLATELLSLVGVTAPHATSSADGLLSAIDQAIAAGSISSHRQLFIVVDGLDGPDRTNNPIELLTHYLPAPLPPYVSALTSLRGTDHTTGILNLSEPRWRASADLAIVDLWDRFGLPPNATEIPEQAIDVLRFCEGNYRIAEMLRRRSAAPDQRLPMELSEWHGIVTLVGRDLTRGEPSARAAGLRALELLLVARDWTPLEDLGVIVPKEIVPLLAPHDIGFDRETLVDRTTLAPVIAEAFPDIDLRHAPGALVDAIRAYVDRTGHASPSVQWAGGYLGRYELGHLVSSGREVDALNRLKHIESLVDAIAALGYDDAMRELDPLFKYASENYREDHPLSDYVVDIQNVLSTEAHWLRHEPNALPGLLFNALVRRGMNANQIAGEYELNTFTKLRRIVHAPDHWPPRAGIGFRGHQAGVVGCSVEDDGPIVSVDRSGWIFRSVGGRNHPMRYSWDRLTSVTAFAVARGGNRVVCGDSRGALFAMEFGKRSSISDGPIHGAPIAACDISADNEWAVSASRNGEVQKWRLSRPDEGVAQNLGRGVIACRFTTHGVIVAEASGAISLLDTDSLVRRTAIKLDPIHACAIDGEPGSVLVARAGVPPSVVRLVVGADGERFETDRIGPTGWTPSLRGAPTACAFGEDWFAIAVGDAIDLTTAQGSHVLYGHRDAVTSLASARIGERDVLLSTSEDCTMRTWDLHNGLPVHTEGRYATPQSLVAAEQGRCGFGLDEGKVFAVPLDGESEPVETLVDHPVTAAISVPNTDIVLAGLSDGSIVALSNGLRTIRYWRGEGAQVTALTYDPVTRQVAVGKEDGAIQVLLLKDTTLEPIGQLAGHRAAVNRIVALDDGWVSASEDSMVCEWHKDPMFQRRRLEGHVGPVRWFDVSSDGRVLATAGADGRCFVWPLGPSSQPPRLIHAGDRGLSACAISPNGRLLAIGGDDGVVTAWEMGTGRIIATLEGHTRSVIGLTFIVDDQILSWSLDRTMRQWSLGMKSPFDTTYGEAPFISVRVQRNQDSLPGPICALDGAGMLWVLDHILPT